MTKCSSMLSNHTSEHEYSIENPSSPVGHDNKDVIVVIHHLRVLNILDTINHTNANAECYIIHTK